MTESLYPNTVVRTGNHVVTAMCFLSTKDDEKNVELLVAGN